MENEVVKDVLVTEEPAGLEPAPTVLPAGAKTPPELLLKSLQEERDKRKELEDRITLLESSNTSEYYSDEGKALKGELLTLQTELSEVRGELTKKDVLMSYPVIKEKWEEFESFRADPENKGMSLKTSARAFLLENGLLEPTRKGLEKPTGGTRVPVTQEMSTDDIKSLRETNFRKYQDLLEKGLIKA